MSRAADVVVGREAHAEWWRCLFDSSEEAQVVCDLQGNAIEFNRRAILLFGFNHRSALPSTGLTLNHLLTASGARKVTDIFRKASHLEEVISGLTVVIGGRLTMIADLHVVRLSKDHALLIFRDASRRWRMESHMHRLVTAIDATPDVFFLTDAEFRLTYVNAAFQNVTGHTIEEALGNSTEMLYAAGQSIQIQECLEKLKAGSDWSGELLNQRQDGSHYYVEASFSPIYDKGGVFLGCVCYQRDISAKKRLQDEVLIERNLVCSIVNSLDVALYTVDRHLRLTQFNHAWKSFPAHHGWLNFEKGGPEVGIPLLDYVSDPHSREELSALFESVLMFRKPQEMTAVYEQHHWLIQVSPWQHGGEVSGLIYMVKDQSKFHTLQNQLYQSQKMETIGALAAGVAHDFNNLLTVVRGNITLLQMDDQLTEAHKPWLQQIDNAARRATEITQQLLSFSRTSDEKVTVIDFNQVVREASALARRTSRGRVPIKLELHEPVPRVRMDMTRANQLLLNLCVNAADAMPNGGQITITNQIITLTGQQSMSCGKPAGTSVLRCSVADTGTGIPPEVLPRIFEAFFTTKGVSKGTGLGLSIVQNVVANAGGFVEIDTGLGRGTTFHIHLPLAEAALTSSAPEQAGKLSRGRGKLLVVDDLDLVLEFTRTVLTEAGYEVFTACSADAALNLLSRGDVKVDLVLSDYNMPSRNGLSLIREIKQLYPAVKLAIASGFLDERERRLINQEVGAAMLDKPFSVTDVTRLIADLLG